MAILRATFTAYVDDGPTGDTLPVILEWTSTDPSGQIDVVNLPAATDVTLSAPPGTNTILCLIPPPTNANTWVIKGNAADVGTLLRTAQPTVLGYSGGVSILRSTVGITGVRVVWL